MNLQEISIQWWNNNGQAGHLNEEYDGGMQYSMFSLDGRQNMPFHTCRDFQVDAIQALIHNKKNSIYGFSYDPKTDPPIDLKATRILLTNSDDSKFIDKMEGMLDFINQVNKLMRFKKTVAYKVNNPPDQYKECGVVATVGSERWQRSPVLHSMYSLLIRVGFRHKVGKDWRETVKGIVNGKIPQYQDNDRDYLKKAVPGIERLIALDPRQVFFKQHVNNYPANIDIYKLHHHSGICAFAEGTTKSIKKYWHRKELDEKYNELKTKSVIL